ncbi:MAG: tRNA-dihydrouridine synthase family protein [Bacteroidales bacterium]
MQFNKEIHLAPLQGFTDAPFRNAHAQIIGGIDTYYTPFVRIERNEFRSRDLRDISQSNNSVPHLVPQMIASTPEELLRIGKLFIEEGYSEADLNLGCPFPAIAKKHKGSGILKYPEEVKALLAAIETLPELSFSLKMRLGWETPEEAMALIPSINSTPLRHVAIHTRVGLQQYKGVASPELFQPLYESLNMPLFYNGDLNSIEDVEAIVSRYPNIKGVMLGRGLLADPTLAKQLKSGERYTLEQQLEYAHKIHQELFDYYSSTLQGDQQLLTKMQSLWEYWLPQANSKLRKKMMKCGSINNYTNFAEQLFRKG